MRLGIEASNLRAGGGITHLTELLRAAEPAQAGFDQVLVWAPDATLRELPERAWLDRRAVSETTLGRLRWQLRGVSDAARAAGCDLLLVPGGSYTGSFRPFVTMSRNMQPFDLMELRRHGWSAAAARLMLLRWIQSRTFRRADGLIFLTAYARDVVGLVAGRLPKSTITIPHGVDERFLRAPAVQRPIGEYSDEHPFRILYVSIVNVYKHQWHVAEAIARLRAEGLPLALDLVGPGHGPALTRLRSTLARVDPAGRHLRYHGPMPRSSLPALHASSDLCLFASSCENMPNILLEGMASGLPVACSRRGPMPEILGSAGAYFDPEDPVEIADSLRSLLGSHELRAELARRSFERAREFTWRRCATATFGFLASVAACGREVASVA